MSRMTDDELNAIEQRGRQAIQQHGGFGKPDRWVIDTDLCALVDEVRRLRAENARVRAHNAVMRAENAALHEEILARQRKVQDLSDQLRWSKAENAADG